MVETNVPPSKSQRTGSPVNVENITTSSLDALQDAGQRKTLDVVDKLRRNGLSNVLQLPQVVVCGDQSSGKSSVLEAITEIPFPRKENLCTRFATEIILRRDHTASITTKITPDKNRPENEQVRLRSWSKTLEDFSILPQLIEDATKEMGLDQPESATTRAFARDVLSIEICGPDRPQLTLVDLPGLIHSENKSQTKQDVKLIHSLVQDYIANKRTIILAVISAKNDYANQIILDKCRKVDLNGTRTLGIITKPDFLREGSQNEQDWLDLAQNRDVYFELGWHMLKNRGDDEHQLTFNERNEAELSFFSRGRYAQLPRDRVGIGSLRTRLSRLLNNHLKKELPGLKKELEQKLSETKELLSGLGPQRATTTEQRQFLMGISIHIHDIIKSAVSGHYESTFFGGVKTKSPIDSIDNTKRLRAVAQYLNLQFAKDMRSRGHKFKILEDCIGKKGERTEESVARAESPRPLQDSSFRGEKEKTKEPLKETWERFSDNSSKSDKNDAGETDPMVRFRNESDNHIPKSLTRHKAVEWVLKILERSRGRELPGNFNPLLINQLFWEQSEPWEAIAMTHIDRVYGACNQFVSLVLEHCADEDIASRIWTLKIGEALKQMYSNCCEELKRIVADKSLHPITYNHYYKTTLQKKRQKRFQDSLMQAVNKATNTGKDTGNLYTYANFQALKANLESDHLQLDMDHFSAEEALDSQKAYFKDEQKYFINVVAKQVIERHLINALADNIISPLIVAGMSEEEVSFVAAQRPEVTERRTYLESQKKMLESGQETFRRAMGALR
ncbi:hypothetical protein M501DRAFT_1006657 [Patellaria atrata CBS 101060]|uniref:Dynamin family protein n=1 Tax=Patellaria atrata CBS 101060 TaxID=1346257 RepID=A0A9P4S9A6_9PEZI|nr:hypothetical protein M501DRAFT_1006657 [Patellaria atrata CBS 101060]